jgi:hypothetical protein
MTKNAAIRLGYDLATQGFATFHDSDLVEDAEARRERFREKFFRDMQEDLPEVHGSRQRLRDRFIYERRSGQVVLAEAPDGGSVLNHHYKSKRVYKREFLLDSSYIHDLVTQVLIVIPYNMTKSVESFGANLFRTSGVTVNSRHQDNAQFAIIMVVGKNGHGDVTELSLDKEGTQIVFARELNPGDILLFEDACFYHYTRGLQSLEGVPPYRDAFVATIEYDHVREFNEKDFDTVVA